MIKFKAIGQFIQIYLALKGFNLGRSISCTCYLYKSSQLITSKKIFHSHFEAHRFRVKCEFSHESVGKEVTNIPYNYLEASITIKIQCCGVVYRLPVVQRKSFICASVASTSSSSTINN